MAESGVPHFHNDPGVSVIFVGSKEFMCIGARPPFDHPHVFIDMGAETEAICSYCGTLYRFKPSLSAGEADPSDCLWNDAKRSPDRNPFVTPLRVAIVGGGIGGLTAALALSGPGREITIFEKRTGFGEAGAGIQLSPNATRCLFALGLEGALRRVACEPDRIAIRSLAGREIGAVTLGGRMRTRYGSPYWSVARADLHTALLDAVRSRPDIRLAFGREVMAISDQADRAEIVSVTSADARDTTKVDLVVGADGLWSRTRGLLGDGRTPDRLGFVAYRATVPSSDLAKEPVLSEPGLWLGAGRHVVHYPIAAGRLVNVVAVERRESDGVEGWSAPVGRDRVLSAFARAAEPLRLLLAAAPSWAAWSLHDLPVRTMAKGRVALIGDAAHPALPFAAQGGALAIEDAVELAAALRRESGIVAALAGFERRQLGRARRLQSLARRNGRTFHLGLPLSAIRDAVIRRLGPDGMADRQAWIHRPALP